MAEDTPISPEAQERHAYDQLKADLAAKDAQLAQATQALQDVTVRDRLVEHFSGKGLSNPFQVATKALNDLRGTEADALASTADAWYEEQRALFGGGEAPKQASPFAATQAAPQGRGDGNTFQPLMAGTPEYDSWARGKTDAELFAAMRRGDVVVSDKVKLQQQGIK